MRNFKIDILILAIFIIASSCKKPESEGANNKIAPTDLTINATASTNGTGEVAFTASATNAVTYDYEFGNGVVQTGTNGTVTYQYNQSGNYTVGVTAISSSGLTLKKTANIQVTVNTGTGNNLVWSDEFNTPGAPDPAKWGYDIGTGCPRICGWGNNERQIYTKTNHEIKEGNLVIEGRKEGDEGWWS